MNEAEYLKHRLDDQIDWFERKSAWNQKAFKRLQVAIILASALVPFLVGVLPDGALWSKVLIGALGLLVTAATSMLGLYKFQENWVEYRASCESLRREKFLFLTKTAPYDGEDGFQRLVERVEGNLSRENATWSRYQKDLNVGS